MSQKLHRRTLFLVCAAAIAAIYVVLTWLSAVFGLSGTAAIQLRLSEMLCILPYFTAAAIPGLTVGCLLANLLTAAALPDIIFGTLATLLGAVGTRLLKKWRFLAPLPPIVANTLIIPFVIKIAYVNVDDSLPFLFLTVGIGEILSVGVCGTILLVVLEKYRKHIFPEI
ncbi:MAG: QueT transporter family protein [Clostridia bacterium]|nr:QueT transporter family protein [Clostridia bacterium]